MWQKVPRHSHFMFPATHDVMLRRVCRLLCVVPEVSPHALTHSHKTYIHLPQPPAPPDPSHHVGRDLMYTLLRSFTILSDYNPSLEGAHTLLCPSVELFLGQSCCQLPLLRLELPRCLMDGLLTALSPLHGTLCMCRVPFLHDWFTQSPVAAHPHPPISPDTHICPAWTS